MQKLCPVATALLLAACSSNQQTVNHAPLDMQTVASYEAKVYSGDTVAANYKVKNEKPADNVLNASDTEPRRTSVYREHPRVILAPSVGYYRGWRHW